MHKVSNTEIEQNIAALHSEILMYVKHNLISVLKDEPLYIVKGGYLENLLIGIGNASGEDFIVVTEWGEQWSPPDNRIKIILRFKKECAKVLPQAIAEKLDDVEKFIRQFETSPIEKRHCLESKVKEHYKAVRELHTACIDYNSRTLLLKGLPDYLAEQSSNVRDEIPTNILGRLDNLALNLSHCEIFLDCTQGRSPTPFKLIPFVEEVPEKELLEILSFRVEGDPTIQVPNELKETFIRNRRFTREDVKHPLNITVSEDFYYSWMAQHRPQEAINLGK